MDKIIKPKILKGFRDFPPDKQIPRQKIIRLLEDCFYSCGYQPIDTPALEYAEILLSKGGGETDKQVYRFTDHGKRDVALRFDLTVPFARYVTGQMNNLILPFRRYHIGKVWRGENTQRGRYREFVQCDFDIVGSDSLAADVEIMLMIAESLAAIDAGRCHIRYNHRALFGLLLSKLGLENNHVEILRIVDKLGKLTLQEVQSLLEAEVGSKPASDILYYISPEETSKATLDKMSSLADAKDHPACIRVRRIMEIMDNMDPPPPCRMILSPSITRGLDYYTGIVFETFLDDLPQMGSVCSGGRYDNLTGLFMKQPVSGIGASIGLDRLMAALEELGTAPRADVSTDVIIFMMEEQLLKSYMNMARRMRMAGLSVEVYPEPKKIAVQFKYAESRNIPIACIMGPDEFSANTFNFKNLVTRQNIDNEGSLDKAIQMILQITGDKQ